MKRYLFPVKMTLFLALSGCIFLTVPAFEASAGPAEGNWGSAGSPVHNPDRFDCDTPPKIRGKFQNEPDPEILINRPEYPDDKGKW